MATIPFQPCPKVPPIGFFEPISVDPKDMMTDVEYLLGILKKLNSMIAQINSNTSFIEDYDGRIEVVEKEIKALREEFTEFKDQVNADIINRFNQIQSEIRVMINATLQQANAYTDTIALQLEQKIQEVSVGAIVLYDPTTGLFSPIQEVINNIFGSTREDALTASEYDNLELTATSYDGYQLTAFDYDTHGKTLLV